MSDNLLLSSTSYRNTKGWSAASSLVKMDNLFDNDETAYFEFEFG
jgi:hypothetical protein